MENEQMLAALTPAAPGPTLVQIADRVIGRPLLLLPGKVEVLLHVLEGRLPLAGADLAPLSPDASRFLGEPARGGTFMVHEGVALIPVIGSLVNRGAWIGTKSGLTSYEGLAKQISDAAADPKVKGIILDLDSPGGEATGMFGVAAKVREAAAQKQVVAVVNDMAASAAYGIASQATEIVVSPTSIVGSIGVVLTHLDRSGELATKGIKPTLIFAGRHKVDGNPFGPLSDAVRADLQAEVLKFYDQFVGLVAQGRGAKMDEQSARATEARTYLGEEAVRMGLADRVASLDEVLAGLSSRGAKAAPNSTPKKGLAMSQTTEAAPQAENAGITQAHVDAARAEGMNAGAAAERARIAGILTHAEAEGRAAQATALALETDLSAEAAAKVLAVSPKVAVAPVSGTPLADRNAGLAEFGAAPVAGAADKVRSGWSAAVKSANRAIGAAN